MIAFRLIRRRATLASATLLAVVVAALGAATPAGATSSANCARQLIADWYDNNRVDRIYALRCYRQAIKLLPVDVRVYSGAEDDILRALLYAQQGKPDPGDKGNGNDDGKTPPGGKPDEGKDPGPGPQPGPVDTSGPSAVPVPLIVLAGIAGLLLVLGAAGYVTRRLAARRGGGEPPAA